MEHIQHLSFPYLPIYNANGCQLSPEFDDIPPSVKPSRAFIAKICKRRDMETIQYLLSKEQEHNNGSVPDDHVRYFDRLAIFASAIHENTAILQILFEHQPFPDLDVEQLIRSLQREELYDVIDFLVSIDVIDMDKLESIVCD